MTNNRIKIIASNINTKKRNTNPTISPRLAELGLLLDPVTGGVVTTVTEDCLGRPESCVDWTRRGGDVTLTTATDESLTTGFREL